jgi:hypothetical protein
MARARQGHTPTVSITLGGQKGKRKGRSSRGYRRRNGSVGVAIWAMLAAIIGLIGILLDATALIIAGVLLLAVAGLTALVARHAGPADRVAAPTGAKRAKTGSGPPRGPRANPGPSRRSPVAGKRTTRCGSACQHSSAPSEGCDCSCKGANHGRLRDGARTIEKPTPRRPGRRIAEPSGPAHSQTAAQRAEADRRFHEARAAGYTGRLDVNGRRLDGPTTKGGDSAEWLRKGGWR